PNIETVFELAFVAYANLPKVRVGSGAIATETATTPPGKQYSGEAEDEHSGPVSTKSTSVGPPIWSKLKAIYAPRGPGPQGLNTTSNVQLAPASRMARLSWAVAVSLPTSLVQLFVCEYSRDWGEPPIPFPYQTSSAGVVPQLVTVRLSGGLVVPIICG